jgi:T-complex protein 1 subunit delta
VMRWSSSARYVNHGSSKDICSNYPQSTGCKPIADIDSFTEEKLGTADLVEEVQSSGARIVKVTGIKGATQTVSIVVRGANEQVLDEAERSLHDAQCVIRCLVKKK